MIRDQRGFTLLEVLIAITLFSIGILIFSSMFVSSFQHSNKQNNQLVAINLARQVASEWAAKPYSDLSIKINKHDPDMEGTYTINEHNYHWKVSVNPPPSIANDTTSVEMLIIKVDITDQNSTQILATVHSSGKKP